MLKKVLTNAVLPILASFIIGAILISAIGASPEDVLSVIGDIFFWFKQYSRNFLYRQFHLFVQVYQ